MDDAGATTISRDLNISNLAGSECGKFLRGIVVLASSFGARTSISASKKFQSTGNRAVEIRSARFKRTFRNESNFRTNGTTDFFIRGSILPTCSKL